ncbi:MAG: penicillin-binding protein activator, partial [Polyangiales bacterium]
MHPTRLLWLWTVLLLQPCLGCARAKSQATQPTHAGTPVAVGAAGASDASAAGVAPTTPTSHATRPRAGVIRVGVLAALRGRAQMVGRAVAEGATLAAAFDDPRWPQVQLFIRDTASDPAQAVQLLRSLAQEHGVRAIVGPADGRIAKALHAACAELGVVLLALSPAPGVAAPSRGVLRYFLTPTQETAQLLAASRAMGHRRYAVLHPEATYGRALARVFRRAAETGGAISVRTYSYPPGATSFADLLQTLRGQSFDAIFIADGRQHLAVLAPALATIGLWRDPAASSPQGPRLLVPSIAAGDALTAQVGRYLQGALLSVPLRADALDFRADYQSRFGRMPSLYAVFAHDAVQVLRGALAPAPSAAAPAVSRWLQQSARLAPPLVGP